MGEGGGAGGDRCNIQDAVWHEKSGGEKDRGVGMDVGGIGGPSLG